MKNMVCASVLALTLLSLPTPRPTAAQAAGQSTSGSLRFTLVDNLAKYVEFTAATDDKGVTTGRMTLSGQTIATDPGAEGGDPRSGETPSDFYVKAEFDCLTVNRNRAVMGGTVRESNPKSNVGQRVLLVVEDNYPAVTAHDRLTWILYNPTTGGWVPKDAERPDDNGAYLKWTATDAERKDDVGVPYPKNSQVVRCQDFPLSSHTFIYTRYETGDIKVRP